MLRPRWGLLALCALLLGAPGAPAKDNVRDARALAERIDRYLALRWERDQVTPAALADDSEFLRRVYLDLVGRIPLTSEVRRFLKDSSPDKRPRLIETLLKEQSYATHMTHVWRALLLPETDSNDQLRYLQPGLETWLRKQFAENAGYDKIVRQIVTLPFGNSPNGMQAYYQEMNDQSTGSPVAFYMAKEGKPENLAATTARLFLGARLECAQCHDHPFARWKREQFWGLASFFAGLQRQRGDFYGPITELSDRREMTIPGTDRVVQANFLDGSEPRWKYKVGSRVTLADWMTSPDNPYFARAAANRLWAHFFGTGIVEPVDDFNDENKPSHPELLDDMAREFAAHDFDLKFLIRAITSTKAYQLTSAASDPSQESPRQFARMAVKGLTPEQLYDSLVNATGYRDMTPANQRIYDMQSPRAVFVSKFSTQEKRTEYQTSIPQALALMNSQLIADVTSLQRSELLGAVAESPFLETPDKVEALFLAALSRKPRAEEAERLVKYVNDGGATKDKKKALADVFWALLNSPEFILNH
ncbi:MAG TPA: DUF1549 and DUF1553 domain-containing protein [Gemmataceae bacterium]|nr:DUF1549 and DUF1553 domain-containing protein [Gemmataceae bacterium]